MLLVHILVCYRVNQVPIDNPIKYKAFVMFNQHHEVWKSSS